MVQRQVVQVVDDLDGTQLEQHDAHEVAFALDGQPYLIDLSTAHADELRSVLGRYVDAARRDHAARAQQARAAVNTSRSGASGSKRDDLDAIRAWAREHGHAVADRGRIAAAVVTAYDEAH